MKHLTASKESREKKKVEIWDKLQIPYLLRYRDSWTRLTTYLPPYKRELHLVWTLRFWSAPDACARMDEKENKGLALLPLQDVVVGLILPLLSHQDWCALRAVDTTHLQIVTEFFAANRKLELPYCKQLTEQGLSLLTSGSSSLRSLTLSGKFPIRVLTDAIYCFLLNQSAFMMFLLIKH